MASNNPNNANSLTSPPAGTVLLFTGEGRPSFQEWSSKLGIIRRAKGWPKFIETDQKVQDLRAKSTQTQADLDLIAANNKLANYIILSVSRKASDVCLEACKNHDAFEIMSALKKAFDKKKDKPTDKHIINKMNLLQL